MTTNTKVTHEDNIKGNKEYITSEKLSNKVTHKDNIEGNKIDKINEITTFDEKEFLLNKSKVDFSVDDDAYDKRWNNTYEYRNSDKEFVLTDKGYELKNNSKAWYYIKDTGKGFLRGGVKLTEGIGSLALATLEKMNIVSEGSVENFANF